MKSINDKISALRLIMKNNNVDAVIIPSSDAHQSEYVADCFALREYLSGFSGSAGNLVVLKDEAFLFTDSRYELQSKKQLEATVIEPIITQGVGSNDHIAFLSKKLNENSVLAIDGRVFSLAQFRALKNELENKNISIKTDFEPSIIWEDKPQMPSSKMYLHSQDAAGEDVFLKISKVKNVLKENNSDFILFEALDEIAYLLNIRGADVDYNPVTYAYLLISENENLLFTHKNKIPEDVKKHLEKYNIKTKDYFEIEKHLISLDKKSRLIIDTNKFSARFAEKISCLTKEITSPVILWKAIKNENEIKSIKQAMAEDAVALVAFYRDVEQNAVKNSFDEADVAELIIKYRKENENYISESFPCIAGFKENGAIVHYRPYKSNAKKIQDRGLLLIDCGAQSKIGTTDITRVICFGNPSEEEKKAYTLVLKTHINLANLVFPYGYCGAQLDAVGRAKMWKEGLNYSHGTGHGIGAAINVHEGPNSFGNKNAVSGTPFESGMINTIEPGYYKENNFGIRIENCYLVVEKFRNQNGIFLGFEAITLAPFEPKLIDVSMLDENEKQWLKNYNLKLKNELLPLLKNKDNIIWLEEKILMPF